MALVALNPPQLAPGARPTSPSIAGWLACFWIALLCIQVLNVIDFRVEPHARSIPAGLSLVFLIVGVFHKLKQRPEASVRLRVSGVLLVFSLCVLQSLAIIFHTNFAHSVAVFLTISALLWTLFGLRVLFHFAPVLLFAAFAFTPTPDEIKQYLTIPLQHLSAAGVVTILKPFLPLEGSGHLFIANGHKFDVTPACSGLNQWVALSYLFLLSAMFIRYRIIGFIVGLSADPVITLCMNVCRLIITAVVACFSTVECALAIHTNVEFLIFPFGVAALWFGLRRFKKDAT